MKSVIQQLDRDSLLVMYAGDELSADDRQRVEQMLAADPSLRADLAQFQSAQDALEQTLASADDRARLPLDPRVAERRIGRMIRDWRSARPETPPTVVQKVVGLKYPWWSYPLTAAAAVFLAFLVWYGHAPMRSYSTSPIATDTTQTDDQSTADDTDPQTQFVAELEQSFTHPSHESIRAAEGELYALSRETEDWDDAQSQQDVNQ